MSQSRSEIEAALSGALQDAIKDGVPGVSAVIRTSKGVVWQGAAGLANIETELPASSANVFGIGSITKVFVAVVILQLVEEGKLKLSDTLEDHLDEYLIQEVGNAKGASIATLLSHSAGVESWEDDPVWIVEGRGSGLDPQKHWGKAEPLKYIQRPSPLKPGKISYSNTNFTYLGFVIEKVTRAPAEAEIRRRILEPLDLSDTFLEGFETHTASAKLPHRYHFATETFKSVAGICPGFSQPQEGLIDATPSNLSVEWTAGGMVSTPSDLTKLGLAIRDAKIFSKSSLAIMQDFKKWTKGFEMGHSIFRYKSIQGYGTWCGHLGSVLGFTGVMFWEESSADCVVAVLANVGTMHCGPVPGSAYDVVLKGDFLKYALEFAALED
ncbi:hypothetical protein BP5796_04002 [Coleophoma crateriformis]|uniref:Beta-lactamase-related domain-containing protein n=1 Tax=Coleophoma crateriformis TaxID=565419 RepID=A0A3D8SH51_9HELO|nr:hypothetical protein BP5796_04002 [Coleophoma crateriformis]